MGFNVLTDRCFPVVMRSGERRWVDFAGLACGFSAFDAPEVGADYAVAFDWPRPDLDIACHELSIGVLQLCLDVQIEDDWQALWDSALGRDELAERIAPFTHAFELLGEGPRFLQDREAFEADLKPAALSPVEGLFIDTPGQNGQKKNADVLTHRGRYPALGLPAAAMTLYALQAFAPAGGAGNRTSMRGGGPLSVLVFPVADEGRAPVALWHRLLANVTELGAGDATSRLHTILPWLAPTLTSEGGVALHPDEAGATHPLQAFFGMPRRLRLVASAQPQVCALTGQEGLVVTHFAQRPYGMNYGIWQHPLTPYRQMKETEPPYSVKPKTARFGYRDWMAAAAGEGKGSLSRLPLNVHAARLIRMEPLLALGRDPVLCVGGWAMNNMEAMAYQYAEQPMHLASDRATAKALDELVLSFSEAASEALSALRDALRKSRFSGQLLLGEKSLLVNAQTAFFEATEPRFHRLAAAALQGSAKGDFNIRADRLRAIWRWIQERTVLSIFDQLVPIGETPAEQAQEAVDAYVALLRTCRGYGPGGKRFFQALCLPQPKPATEKTKGASFRKIRILSGGGLRTMKLNKPAVEAARDWWQRLHPNPVTGRGGDRAGRARLRRAAGPLEALLEPQAQALIEAVRQASGKDWALQAQFEDEESLLLRFGVLAILLAETELHFEERQRGFAGRLGQTPDGLRAGPDDRRRWSASRFGAMMRAWKEPNEFCRHIRRALPVLKREPFDVAAFIRDVIGFDGAVQRKWTFDYYGQPQHAAGDGKAEAQESPAATHDSPEEN